AAPGVGEGEHLGRSPPSPPASDPLVTGDHDPFGGHGVQVAPDRGRSDTQTLGEGGSRLRPALEDRPGYPLPRPRREMGGVAPTLPTRRWRTSRRGRRRRRRTDVFHNLIVLL